MQDAYGYDGASEDERLEDILFSPIEPLAKIKQIMKLGFEEEYASDIVERYQLGMQTPVYYERLNFDEGRDEYEH